MPAFEPAPYEAAKLAHEVVRELHPGLARVKMAVLFASEDGGKLPPVAARGTSAMHRAAGAADLLLIVSEAAWKRRDDRQRRALVDHGFAAVEAIERNNCLALDTAGRPRLRRVPRDCELGYLAVWRRWGAASVEAQTLARVRRKAAEMAEAATDPGPDPE